MAQLTDTLENSTRVSSAFKPQLVKTERKHVPRWLVVVPTLVLALAAATEWWLYARQFESTDDAQIEGHLNPISARISGNVSYINPAVENNHYVEAGTLLFELDPNDYQVALDHAQADLMKRQAAARSAGIRVPIVDADAFSRLRAAEAARDEAVAAVDVEEANLSAAQHKVDQDLTLYERAERDRIRYQALVEKREISRSEYDARETDALSAAQALAADRALVATAEKRIAEAHSRVAEKEAEVRARRTAPEQVTEAQAQYQSNIGDAALAKADVRTAELNLQYTKIYAPISGVVGRKTVEVGQHIQPGQSLLAIVPLDDIWVTANFKETQLKLIRPGQHVRVHADAFDRDYTGTIDDLPGAAGNLFSLLPPENASGNFVKVIQRLPVRIRFDAGQDVEHALRPGMSVEPKVKVR